MPEKLKDIFFTVDTINAMLEEFKKAYPAFDEAAFKNSIYDDSWKKLELKEKMRHVTLSLSKVLPEDFEKAADILMKSAPGITGFEAMCLPDYVELFGLEQEELSLQALECFTCYSSSEFGIRPFLKQNLTGVMAFMNKLSDSDNPKIRRFSSEGCRPRLPWAQAVPALKKDPSLIIPILEKLKDDQDESVQKSVANNLNDISKDNPEIVLEICRRWQGTSKTADWIIKQGLRTLLKQGVTDALILFDFADPSHITVENLTPAGESLFIGESQSVSFDLVIEGEKETKVRTEYAVYYMKAKGKTSKKVFQISEKSYQPGRYSITKKQSFEDMSTRKHYPGTHRISIIVNGVEKAECAFELKTVN